MNRELDSDRRLGWILIGTALTLIFLSQIVPVYTVDVFYHLAVGEWILDQGSVPEQGLFSATRGERPWVDNEWGFQVLVAIIDRAFGLPGLIENRIAI